MMLRRIPDDAVLRLAELREALGLPKHTLAREARLGRLRVARRAGQLWTTGAWVREWIESAEVPRREEQETGNGEVAKPASPPQPKRR
jgi:hypothetical protein